MFILVASIVVFFFLNLLLGSVHIPAEDVLGILVGSPSDSAIWNNIVLKSRIPQALTAIMAGAGLAVSGLLMQTVFRASFRECRWHSIE